MKQIAAINYTKDFLTSKGGLAIGHVIEDLLKNSGEQINVSFANVINVSPSFVNGSFLYLIDNYGVDFFRERVKVSSASPNVAKTIGDSVRTYINRQATFYDRLRTNSIYLAGDNSQTTAELLKALSQASDEKGVSHFSNSNPNFFSSDTLSKIKSADVFIGILTDPHGSLVFEQQLKAAIDLNKPCLLLQDRSIVNRLPTATHDKIQVIYYDRNNPVESLKRLNETIQRYKRENELSLQTSNEVENKWLLVLGALLITVVLAAVFFSSINSEKNEKKPS